MKSSNSARWLIWALAAFFYFYEYLLRVSPNVMVPELMSAFHVSAGALGVLAGSFLIIYAPMQLPVGILMDRYGARKLLTFASIGCGIGAFLFGAAKTMGLAFAGRILIGASSAFAFVGMVYVCSHWFEPGKRALLVGLANSISMLGAFAGGGPLSIMVQRLGWRMTLFVWGIVGIVLAFIIFFLARTEHVAAQQDAEVESPNTLLEGIKIYCSRGYNWLNAAVALLAYTVTTAIGGLWGVPFVQTAYNVRKEVASFAISMIFFGWLVGSPVMGFISDRLNNRKWVIFIGVFAAFLCFTPVVYFNTMSIKAVYILIFLTGFFSAAQLLNFTFATEINPSRIKGASVAITNFAVASGGAVVQPLIGYFLEKTQPVNATVAQYVAADYKISLTILPICLFAASILALFLSEKKRTHPEY